MDEGGAFDAVVSGTSLANAVLAAALARAGRSVLHVDARDAYGEEDATLDLAAFVAFLRTSAADARGFVRSVSVSSESAVAESAEKFGRSFALDVSPKVLLSGGPLVQLLVRSGVAKYMEFKCLQSSLLARADDAEPLRVPCSKADVFQSQAITLLEKRFLMKFLTTLQQPLPEEEWGGKSFSQLLDAHQLNQGVLQLVIVHAICGLDSVENVTAKEGAALVRRYVESVGRFGATPFLVPLYGCSESAQAFCRMAAVKGAVYILRRSVERFEEGNCVIDSEGGRWESSKVIVSPNHALAKFEREERILYRAYCFLKKPSAEPPLAHSTFLLSNGHVAHAVLMDASLKVCPKDHFLVYLWSAHDVLEEAAVKLGEYEWLIQYSVQRRVAVAVQEEGILGTSDPDGFGVDYDACIAEARRLFEIICGPDEEFFPPAEVDENEGTE